MTATQQIAETKARLDRAVASTAHLRKAGTQEQYLQSYFLVEALEIQLDRLLKDPPFPAWAPQA
jgi:hypothetical protein